MKALKKLPTFKNEDAEREFWANEDSTEYIDWPRAETLILPNLRPTRADAQKPPSGRKRSP